MIGDTDLAVAKLYNMLPAEEPGTSEGRTAATNQTVRTVFVIGPDKKIKMMLTYPMTTGRNFDEILRVIDSMQLTAKHKVATPVNWKHGEDVIIVPSVSDDDAKKTYPGRLEDGEAVPPHRQAAALIVLRSALESVPLQSAGPGDRERASAAASRNLPLRAGRGAGWSVRDIRSQYRRSDGRSKGENDRPILA